LKTQNRGLFSSSTRRGQEGAEVVDGADEVVEVRVAELLDIGLAVPRRTAERGEQRLVAAAREGPAHEGA
jgi:hypothetical protein